MAEPKQIRAAVDPVTLEIIRQLLQSIPDEVETDLTRTAFSPLIYEYKDYAVGMVDAQGALIAQSRGGIPIFLANVLGLAVRDGLATYGPDGISAGDVIITNHAGTLGQHLNNIVMFTPVMDPAAPDRIIAFMAILAHWTDIGGKYVGSSASNDSTDIFQEGIQFRCIRLRSRGQPVAETYRMIEYNTRFPEAVLGDVEAQMAGCLKGAALLEQLASKFGARTLLDAIGIMWSQSEQQARSMVRAIPDGTYQAAAFLDNDGIDLDKAIECPITVRIDGERFIVDFSDISPQVRGPFNSGRYGGGETCARIAFKYLTTPRELTNEGSFAPLEVILPEGKFLSASATAPMARYSAPLSTVVDTIIQAMAGAIPDKIAAGHHASMGSHRFQGLHPDTGRLFSHLDTSLGGMGALNDRDGTGPFKTLAHGDTLDVPVEVQEMLYGLHLDRIEFRRDSAGAGQFRGGLGIDKEYTIKHPVKLTLTFERHGCPPWGVLEGKAAAPNYVDIRRRGDSEPVRYLKITDLPLGPGDKVYIHTGGGGGYGPPQARDPAAIALDIQRGYVSAEAARRDYGAVADAIRQATAAGEPLPASI
ncbi:Acetophenone carboxylase delta subunit [Pigmentiphaga humi]|uniref:Acetophenone carboxylase delta subunit n=2 Tax=Pigmentiphaga humi TaxID=2478468 RepID=A0A3P4B963_9BURK|nr:Acetophenone carboxylase delta subunit [Pigmentiphaga humi]